MRSTVLSGSHLRAVRSIEWSSSAVAAGAVSIGFAVAWLLPYHTYPFWSFYNDYTSLLAVVMAALILHVDRKRAVSSVPAAVFVPLLLIAVIVVDAVTGRMAAPREAILPIGYLGAAVLAMVLGRNVGGPGAGRTDGLDRTYRFLTAALLGAGLLSAVITYYQYLRIDDLLGDWSVAIGGDGTMAIRPYANLGQPNQLALLLCWSLAALWWTFLRSKLGGPIAAVLAALLLSSVALTQSKVAWLILPALVALVWYGNRRLDARKVHAAVLVGLVLLFVAFVLLLPSLSHVIGTQTEGVAKRMETNGVRSVMILQGFYIGLQHPLFGVGWSGFGAGQVEVAPSFGETQYAMHAHDFVANLAAETGWLVTIAVIAAMGVWLFRRYHRRPWTINTFFALMIFTAVGLHSLVEFPLWYAYVLLPVALLVGLVDSELAMPGRASITRGQVVALGFVGAFAMVGVAADYRELVQGFRAFGLRRIGFDYAEGSTVEPKWTVFPHFYRYMAFADVQPTVGMSPAAIADADQIARRFGYAPVLMRLATIYALNDRPDDAVRMVDAIRHLFPQRYRETYAAWQTLGEEYPSVLGKVAARLPRP